MRDTKIRIGLLGLVVAAVAAAIYRLRRASSGADDRIDAPSAVSATAEPSLRGRSEDPAQQAAPVTDSPPSPGDGLASPAHEPPEGSVVPDTSAGDPLVDDATAAAAAQAGSIGGDVETAADDPAMRPVLEGSGDEGSGEADEGDQAGAAGSRSERSKPA